MYMTLMCSSSWLINWVTLHPFILCTSLVIIQLTKCLPNHRDLGWRKTSQHAPSMNPTPSWLEGFPWQLWPLSITSQCQDAKFTACFYTILERDCISLVYMYMTKSVLRLHCTWIHLLASYDSCVYKWISTFS